MKEQCIGANLQDEKLIASLAVPLYCATDGCSLVSACLFQSLAAGINMKNILGLLFSSLMISNVVGKINSPDFSLPKINQHHNSYNYSTADILRIHIHKGGVST